MEGSPKPLCIDLDGTLVPGDTLIEAFIAAFRRDPGVLFKAPIWLAGGRAKLKAELARMAALDATKFPYRQALLDYIKSQKEAGRSIYLVSAADQNIVDSVAEHLGLFEDAWGSDGSQNLKGIHKRAKLEEVFPQGYAYAGDAAADLPVWEGAAAAVIVGGAGLAQRVADLCPVEQRFEAEAGSARAWLRSLRMHQWSKNLLVFVPLLLSGDFRPQNLSLTVYAFLLLSLVCSGTYLVNDVLDMQEDRDHWAKRLRPIAAGQLSLATALVVAMGLCGASLAVAWFFLPQFAVWLTAYLITTLLYTLHFKQVPMLDLFILGGLFTCRVGMGVAVLGHDYSVWLFVFTAFFFFGLAAVKRYVEIGRAVSRNEPSAIRSAYRPDDLSLVQVASVTAGLASLVVMALYLESGAFPAGTYGSPQWLWCSLPVVGLWLGRIWLLAGRLQLADDPVTFALKDRVSWLLGVLLVISVGLSHTG